MDELNIQLFKDDGSKIAMPSISNEELEKQKSLVSENVEKGILGDTVKTLLIPEDAEIADLNYIFDFSTLESINPVQKEALKALVRLDGNVQLYLYKSEIGLTAFGTGDDFLLEKMVPLIKFHVFNDEIRVVKNFKRGHQLNEVKTMDFTKMRLNL